LSIYQALFTILLNVFCFRSAPQEFITKDKTYECKNNLLQAYDSKKLFWGNSRIP
jgi:hypothetical protein